MFSGKPGNRKLNLSNAMKLPRAIRAAVPALAVAVAASAVLAWARPPGDATSPVPVIVELFTSEGCSSCPPVDTFLRKLDAVQPIQGVEVIGMEEHVDYWNQDGWVDPYSGMQWTSRQKEYVFRFKDKTPYTPQMIVDGAKEMVNPTTAGVFNAIRQAAEQENTQVSVEPGARDGKDAEQFRIHVATESGSAKQPKADVWLAVTEDGLQMQVTAGENNGRTLRHAAVVRSLERIGTISRKGAFSADPRVKFKSNWNKPNLRVIVFVQDHKSLRIVGVGAAKVSG